MGERGENQWEQIPWDQALDEIAAKLAELKEKYGPETLAVHEGTYRSDMYAMRTRFLNLFGNPSNIGCAGTICRCNTVAMNYASPGHEPTPAPKRPNLKCLVLHGCDLSEHGSPGLPAAQATDGARAISSSSSSTRARPAAGRFADIWVQLRPGTDTALFLGWINVIIEEGLYDKEFVDEWTFGFDAAARPRGRVHAREGRRDHLGAAGRHPRVGPHVRHQLAGRLPLGLRPPTCWGATPSG